MSVGGHAMDAAFDEPRFKDDDAARAYLETLHWPNGPVCPHCGERERVTRLQGKAHRPGVVQCNNCRRQFTVTVGTVMERSKIALHKWVLAMFLMCASKKGMSASADRVCRREARGRRSRHGASIALLWSAKLGRCCPRGAGGRGEFWGKHRRSVSRSSSEISTIPDGRPSSSNSRTPIRR